MGCCPNIRNEAAIAALLLLLYWCAYDVNNILTALATQDCDMQTD